MLIPEVTYYIPKVILFKKLLCNVEAISVLKNCKVYLKLVDKFITRY